MSPSRPLRAELAEAIARSRHERIRHRAAQKGIPGIVDWDEVKTKAIPGDESDTFAIRMAEAGEDLDAFLDALETRADEWDDLAEAMWQVSPIDEQRDWWHPHFRIAVLREGDEQ